MHSILLLPLVARDNRCMYMAHVCFYVYCVCFAYDPSERLDAPSICFVCVFHLGV